MKGQSNIYHLCNLSPKVIFRNHEDYLDAINRLAACACATSTEVWAYAFMSTHFHIIVRTDKVDEFIKLFKVNISRLHNKRYLNYMQISISKRSLLGKGEILTAVNYVLKNPMHHQITEVAFSYPYSSAHIYYKERIGMNVFLTGDKYKPFIQKPSELGVKACRSLFGSHILPDTYNILDGKVVQPESFVKVRIIERLYESVRGFIYNMNKPLTEEVEMFGQETNAINSNETETSLFGKLTDIKVCQIIDRYIAPKTYIQITPEERVALSEILHREGVNKFQMERCM